MIERDRGRLKIQVNFGLMLSEGEWRSIHRELGKYSRLTSQRHRLDLLISRWIALVRAVEAGYQRPMEDYLRELTVRDVLQELAEALRRQTGTKLQEVLKPWDERYLTATHRTAGRPLRDLGGSEKREWWYRIPNVLCGDLQEDLRRGGWD